MKINPVKLIKQSMWIISIMTVTILLLTVFIEMDDSVDCTGVIQAAEKVQIRSEYSGVIEKIYKVNGEDCYPGDVLLKLKNDNLIIEFKKLELQYKILSNKFALDLDNSERNYKSKSRLFRNKLISYDEFIKTKTIYDQALLGKYDLEQHELNILSVSNLIMKTLITNNVQGKLVYDENNIICGNYIDIGDQIFNIITYGKNDIIADILISENNLSRIKISNLVKVYITAFPYTKYKAIDGFLQYISPISENGFIKAKVGLLENTINVNGIDRTLSYGMTLNAKIIVGKKPIYKTLLGIKEF